MKKEIILVTGAAGFIGYNLIEKLLKDGYKVVGIDNLNDYYDVKLKKKRIENLEKSKFKKNFTFIKLDFTDFKILQTKLKRYKFAKIIHLGAQAGVRYSIENPFIYGKTNYMGTLNIFEFAKQNKIPHVIYALTSSIYGDNTKQPFEESDRKDTPVSIYAVVPLPMNGS
jgi:UDP-glucuronate 4-epimerase